MCERSGDGVSWSPPAGPLQADTKRKLVVVKDVILQSSFPELLPVGPQTNRQGDGVLLGPHVIERGGCQIINRRERSLADESLHRVAMEKNTSLEQNTCLRVKRLPCDYESAVNQEYQRSDQMSAQAVHLQLIARRCAHWAGSKTSVPRVPESDVVFQQKHTCLTTVCVAHAPFGFMCLNDGKRDDIKLFKAKKTQHCRGHVHPCCCLRLHWPATAPSLCTSTRAVARP